ncbi:MAG TPA: NHLP leader peptide family RiPP precursor [Bacillota bacterium]|jgi:hypothetical protein|nr:NHLP leader peptide family RiPP precursor [Peptococcaceae bacterium MAG4]NLW39068.1 NHLP leader peptide family natural product precursor [Peptococcaceae bacterium]HPZ43894.1 NHLP leader peptide family RiPP precursor [Bacillota bacterium]HQD76948.1 NHLP leader peptide family RiPP precursor [Bacillota bacterium]HUM59071.1 NHLP leader peptide family RiPP precursor [Bacillota bacterium]
MSEHQKPLTREELEKKIIKKAQSDHNFKKFLMEKPHEAIAQFGVQVPEEVEVRVVEESANVVYLVVPVNPDELTDELLNAVAGGVADPCFDFSLCIDKKSD